MTLTRRDNAFPITYSITINDSRRTALYYQQEDGLPKERVYWVDSRHIPASARNEILDYAAREMWAGGNPPTERELVRCALENGVLASVDGGVTSAWEWPDLPRGKRRYRH